MNFLQKLPLQPASGNATPARQQDVADYIAAIAFELRQLAISADLPEITAPLEQVYYQAWHVAERMTSTGPRAPPKADR